MTTVAYVVGVLMAFYVVVLLMLCGYHLGRAHAFREVADDLQRRVEPS